MKCNQLKRNAAMAAAAILALALLPGAYTVSATEDPEPLPIYGRAVDVSVKELFFTVFLYGDESTSFAISKARVYSEPDKFAEIQLSEVLSEQDAAAYINLNDLLEDKPGQAAGEASKSQEKAAIIAAGALRTEASFRKQAEGLGPIEGEKIAIIKEEAEEEEAKAALPASKAAPAAKVSEDSLGKAITVSATAYCNCSQCCGSYAGSKTASGTMPQEMRTIAASSSYAFGTKVYIPYFKDKPNAGIFVVEDRGGAIQGNKIDIFFSTHAKAMAFGRRDIQMYVVK